MERRLVGLDVTLHVTHSTLIRECPVARARFEVISKQELILMLCEVPASPPATQSSGLIEEKLRQAPRDTEWSEMGGEL